MKNLLIILSATLLFTACNKYKDFEYTLTDVTIEK